MLTYAETPTCAAWGFRIQLGLAAMSNDTVEAKALTFAEISKIVDEIAETEGAQAADAALQRMAREYREGSKLEAPLDELSAWLGDLEVGAGESDHEVIEHLDELDALAEDTVIAKTETSVAAVQVEVGEKVERTHIEDLDRALGDLEAAEAGDKSGTDDKSGTNRHRKSVLSDGNFVAHLKESGYFERIDGRASSVVYAPVTLPISLSPLKPKQWRDVGEEIRGLMFHAAIKRQPNVKGFTLKLSEEIEKDARAQGKQCLAWLHDRIARHLRRALWPLAECVYWWFAIEEDDKGVMHLHGEVSFDPALEEIVRDALDAAGGYWEGGDPESPRPKPKRRKRKSKREPKGTGKGFAPVEFKTDPDFRWAGYALKSCQKSTRGRRRFMRRYGLEADRRWVAQFAGKSVTVSSALVSFSERGTISLFVGTRSPETVSPDPSLLVMGRRQKFALPLADGLGGTTCEEALQPLGCSIYGIRSVPRGYPECPSSVP